MRTTIKIKRGDDESRLITLKTQSGSAFDLSEVKRVDLHAIAEGKQVLELSTTNQLIEVLDAEKGEMLIQIPHHLTQDENWKLAAYDLQLTFKNERIRTVLEGQMQLITDVTRVQNE